MKQIRDRLRGWYVCCIAWRRGLSRASAAHASMVEVQRSMARDRRFHALDYITQKDLAMCQRVP